MLLTSLFFTLLSIGSTISAPMAQNASSFASLSSVESEEISEKGPRLLLIFGIAAIMLWLLNTMYLCRLNTQAKSLDDSESNGVIPAAVFFSPR
ncbi:hypothetical protein PENTCL1PPCAC_5262 [Pristionchus entomophagus]|uniref:Uncharacterized protein n=1 Tax=Pristionchus entomophagus TaxID=358040 RepID=A0AAV5SIH0_9BILA|nr:hypothetical protein PENTCL1PPCAC_5261 [Pristionchus entomophagus]GMS83087.1 hypothetical protein PENTCL1PPCAC_5262 [Pristionchus entomophagus]